MSIKKEDLQNIQTVATHSGKFHYDDVMSFSILKKACPNELNIIRSRDVKEFSQGASIFDIGGEYNPGEFKFDHHQLGGAGERENGVPYSSAGLVWKHIGPLLVDSYEEWQWIDTNLIQGVDVTDCGYKDKGGKPEIRQFSIFDLVEGSNPTWQEELSDEILDAKFKESSLITDKVLETAMRTAKARIRAKSVVDEMLEKTKEDHMLILNHHLPWKENLLASTHPKAKDVLYVLFPDTTGEWRAQCMITEKSPFDHRKPLPKAWGGLKKEELQALTGVPDATFCHIGLFICGAKSKEGAIALAKKAIET